MLGEGPMWSADEQVLYWVDCSGKRVHRFDPSIAAHTEWMLPEHIGCLVLTETGGVLTDSGFAAAVPRGFVQLDLPPGGGEAHAELLCAVEQDTGGGEGYDPSLGYDPEATVRGMNDGKVDRQGRFWAGSVRSYTPALYTGTIFTVHAPLTHAGADPEGYGRATSGFPRQALAAWCRCQSVCRARQLRLRPGPRLVAR